MYKHIISPEALRDKLNNPDWRIIDCRFNLADTNWGASEYKASHIPGAMYAHLDDDLSGEIISGKTGRHPLPSIDDLQKLFSHWGIDTKTQVVVYDQSHGGIAARLWWMLKWLGHHNVAVLDGGWEYWKREGFQATDESKQFNPSVFVPNPRPEMLVSWEEVKRRFQRHDFQLIDARARERFLGKEEPIDPIAGHIPGAISLPFSENLDSNGRFHSPATLKAKFDAILPADADLICYCGSGVTACHNLLALEYAGVETARLYAGSWSEWITDTDLPVATNEGS